MVETKRGICDPPERLTAAKLAHAGILAIAAFGRITEG
jgi:hypothetical protein